MQTELMLRLLRSDPTSKSGYRIAGYMRIVPGGVYISTYLGKDEVFKPIGLSGIGWNAYDLGIQVDGEWWFGGDRIEYDYGDGRICGTLCQELYCWYIMAGNDYRRLADVMVRNPKRVGNIHEEE